MLVVTVDLTYDSGTRCGTDQDERVGPVPVRQPPGYQRGGDRHGHERQEDQPLPAPGDPEDVFGSVLLSRQHGHLSEGSGTYRNNGNHKFKPTRTL